MWELYEDLIEPIPENIRVEGLVCGQTWTALKNSRGDIGLSMTTNVQTRPMSGDRYVGLSLKTVARYAKSWNLLEASIGMAAINSFYNTQENLKAMGSMQRDNRFCTFDIPLKGKTIGMVGHLRHPKELFAEAKELYIMERAPQEGDYPDSACEYLLPKCELIMITGSAFVNKTMPRLLQLSRDADIIITGPSAPMAPVLLEYGVGRVTGLIPRDKEALWEFVSEGFFRPPYPYGDRYCLQAERARGQGV